MERCVGVFSTLAREFDVIIQIQKEALEVISGI